MLTPQFIGWIESQGERAVISHISRKTSEIWATRPLGGNKGYSSYFFVVQHAPLLRPQGCQRVDARRPARRDDAGRNRHRGYANRCEDVAHRIVGLHTIQS